MHAHMYVMRVLNQLNIPGILEEKTNMELEKNALQSFPGQKDILLWGIISIRDLMRIKTSLKLVMYI